METNTTLLLDETVEKATDDVLTGIRTNYFTAMIGDSDSAQAKSIFMRVKEKTEEGQIMGQAGYLWVTVNLRPGISPIDNLINALSQPDVLFKKGTIPPHFKQTVSSILRSGPAGLLRLQNKIQETYNMSFNLLILVHQFDDLFDFFPEDKQLHTERYDFILLLLSASVLRKAPVYVGISIKPEHLSNCFQYQGLGKTIREKSYILQELTAKDYVAKTEYRFSNRSEDFKAEVKDDIKKLYKSNNLEDFDFRINFLQTALYEVEANESQQLSDFEKYQRVGGLRGVVDFVAEQLFATLQNKENANQLSTNQVAISQVFKAISRVSDGKLVPIPITFDELVKIVKNSDSPEFKKELTLLVQQYQEAGFLEVMEPSEKIKGLFAFPKKTILIPRNAAIINNWKRAVLWAKEESSDALNYQRIARQANDVFIQSSATNNLQTNEQNALKIGDIKNGERLFNGIKINKYWAQQYSSNHLLEGQKNSFALIKQYWKESQERRYNKKQAIRDKEKRINTLFRWAAIFASLLALIAVFSFFWIRNSKHKLTIERENLNQQNFLSILSDAQIIDIDFTKRINIAKNKNIRSLENVIQHLIDQKIIHPFDTTHEESLKKALLSVNDLTQATTNDQYLASEFREKLYSHTTQLLQNVKADDYNINYYQSLKAHSGYLKHYVNISNQIVDLNEPGKILVNVPTVQNQFICADKLGNISIIDETETGGLEKVKDSEFSLKKGVTALAVSPDGLDLYVGTLSGELFRLSRLDMILGKSQKVKVKDISEKIYHIHISKTGNIFVTTKNKIYHGSEKHLKVFKSDLAEINNLTLSPDEQYLVVGGIQKTIFYSVKFGKISREKKIILQHSKVINNVLDISENNKIAMGTEQGDILFFDRKDVVGKQKVVNLYELYVEVLSSGHSPLNSLTFQNKNTLASGTEDGKLILWTALEDGVKHSSLNIYDYENPIRDIVFNNKNVLVSMEGDKITAHRTNVKSLTEDIKRILLENFVDESQ